MPIMHTRRRFLTATLSLAGAAGLVHARPALAGEGAPEITSVRINKSPSICNAPRYVAEELLRAEGFTDIRYVSVPPDAFLEAPRAVYQAFARGDFDFITDFAPLCVNAIDQGMPVMVLAGVHAGCFELFVNGDVHSIADLRGKSIGVDALNSPQHLFLAPIAAHVGIDPSKDINWVVSPSVKPMQLFIDGKLDGFLGLPPEPQELHARRVGHVIVDSTVDRPWSQYFCCMLAGRREFVQKYPIATKRVTRAILKAADLCATEPARAARLLVDGGFTKRYDYALQTLSGLPYDKWREYDAEDTVRFYALRLHETGFIRSSPQKIIADGTDWRFLNELKREMKA
jgi:NitT/TauT family transport system substrate-binding protein